ncbi:choice-of-anchor G family protein [Salinibacterium sp. dk2585]|uniref:IPT/TIG domain-containing protein n=1 Tax=unclassified Salinibacterium TaxID=2632331 RepID=UPI0011C252E1|nr:MULTISPECIES: IPT/TIG domain-containing protein [unclassified Salinibacterium]QEE60478.1 choice-of-anchor G family protein [Salinibacterium sp. dk2585]TXK55550.1 choice-of-anchor G family protein [Salinibacterium sp. dk5596]
MHTRSRSSGRLRSPLLTKGAAATGVAALLLLGAVPPGYALATDTTEAEGRVLSGGGAVNLNGVASLAPAYTASPSQPGAETAPLDLTVLDAVGIEIGGVSLLGTDGVVGVGALQQYASTTPTVASAASGAVLSDGTIDVGGSGVQDNAFVDLGALLGGVPAADGLIDDLRVELGAVSGTATNSGGVLTSDYQIAGGDLVLTSPALGALVGELEGDLAEVSTLVDAIAAEGGALDTALDGLDLGGGLDAILELALGGLVDIDGLALNATLDTDLSAAVSSLPPLVSADGAATINVAAGTITLDLATLLGAPGGTLNDLAPNTELIDSAVLAGLVAPGGAITSALSQLPAALVTTTQETLNAQVLDIAITGTVAAFGEDVVALDVTLAGTVGDFLGVAGSEAPDVLDESTALGDLVPIGDVTGPVLGYLTGTFLPAIVGPLGAAITGVGIGDGLFEPAVATAVTALGPVVGLVSQLVSITANVQETPGEFTAEGAFVTPDTFTQRAATVSVLPILGTLAEVNLASATVRAPVLPTITAIAPDEGPETGGTVVTMTGTDFADATGVTFDGIPGTGFAVVNPTTITVTTPAHAPGPVDVVVTEPLGGSLPATFTYLNVPGITDIDPRFGPEAGGTPVTLTGEGFTGATDVTFDGVPAIDVTVVDDGTITATTPAGAGTVDVVVEHPVAGSAPLDFTYVAPGAPAVTGITPDRGPETGGTPVTISGTDLAEVTAVTFNGVPATDVDVVSDTEVTAVSPAGTPGDAGVVLTNDVGASGPLDFEYFAVTSVDTVTPGTGPEDGGNVVTIIGDCFTGATDVTFAGVSSPDFEVVSDTTITAEVPAGAPGVVDVVVVGTGDCGPGTLPDAYEYLDEPVITAIAPEEGPETGGTEVTLTGTDFTAATSVAFDGVPATAFVVVDDETITATSPAGAPGVADVVVTGPGGSSDPVDFTYVNVPSITSVTPDSGPVDGGTEVTIIGEGFTDATDVTFDGVPGTDFEVVDDSTVTVTTPEGEGVVEVVVEHPVADSAPAEFVYLAPGAATVTSIAPDRGPETGGTTVTITGAGFEAGDGVTGVTFAGMPATDVTIVSDTELTAVSPANAAGVATVVVLNEAGPSAPLGFTYFAVMSINAVDPGVGPEDGGNTVTIVGACFTGATAVTFGGVPAAEFTVVSDTVITAVVPAGTSGTVDVVVVGAGDCGAATVEESYEYTDDAIIWSLSPTEGPESGGTVVTIDGANLGGATGVTIGGVPAEEFTVVTDGRILATTPAGAPGVVDVVVLAPSGDSAAAAFTYLAVAGTGAGGGLPITGAEAGSLGLLGAGLLALGAAVVGLSRRPGTE